ncbi:MAG: 23S rRNA (adenine(2503)-C(2))-methyltransferase RlmN [Spirochaetales bacterium]|nr:23S rRNA (adenine(2503)-C(2))-methyltransferase RlmN [Leptospiraceae bacterium]MCP5482303.1 23S rRNA (adenine(2503)-C(2))-methyltransferase RlmN [Spirochaetales bacterium]MCP5484258.1 23S rRNA (adenine(2503)-C(2))-methyltransferase RlmN [Spirochaetales bacterium]
MPTGLIGKSYSEMLSLHREYGAPPELARESFRRLYAGAFMHEADFAHLPATIRTRLFAIERSPAALIADRRASEDGSLKFLVQLHDGRRVESVYLPFGKRRTVCVSSQVGCVLDCRFCATGAMGFSRNLTAAEIVIQVLLVRRSLRALGLDDFVSNVVFMGMGEPFYNYEAVLAAANLLCDPRGMALAPRHITISTAGVLPAIESYCEADLAYKLAISITAADEELRNRLMPINERYRLGELRNLLLKYPPRVVSRIMFEVPLLGGVNDRQHDAERLAEFCDGLPVRINLIAWNPVKGSAPFESPSPDSVLAFQNILRAAGLTVFVRRNMGRDIAGACGQLAAGNADAAG